MTLFLHIGSHNTGTTAIQDFVARFFLALRVPELGSADDDVRRKNPSLDVIDYLAKPAVLNGDAPDQDLSKAFNNFAFRTPVKTSFGFLDRSREEALLAGLEAGNKRLIATEPALCSVLGPNVPALDRDPIDGEAEVLAQERVEAFRRARR